jgi:nucleotide-binding universal stress UspA family protein
MSNTHVSYNRILCPVDFSECSRKAFYTAVGYARHFSSELVILHVSERNMAVAGFESVEEQHDKMDRLEAGLRRRLDELQSDGHVTDADRQRISLEITGGKPWIEIIGYAAEHECDLIIMGTHGHTGLKHIVIGSQAERVVRRAACHVLCVKPDGYESSVGTDAA